MAKFSIKKIAQFTPAHIILVVAALLRLPYVFTASYTHDELSALDHLQHASFSTMWDYVLHDYHPPLVQFFLYAYTGLLGPIAIGQAEWVVKLPFALCGLWAIWVMYKAGRHFFSEPAGLYAAAFMAITQLFVFHSNVARPYAPGLLFCVLFMYQWLKILMHGDQSFRTKLAYIGFAFLAGSTHYFAGITAGVAGIFGLLLVRRQQIVPYLLVNTAVVVLMLPPLYIMRLQLSHGGLAGWLGAPEEGYFWKFVSYLFHYDNIFLVTFILLLITGILFALKNKIRLTVLPHLSMFMVFVTVYLIAYLYSVYVSPIIQFSILQFSLPFVLLPLFSAMGKIGNRTLMLSGCLVMMATGIYSLFFTRLHHQMVNDYPYKAFGDFCAPYAHDKNVWIVTSDRPEFLARYMDTSRVISTYGKAKSTHWVLEQLNQKKPARVIAGNADPNTYSMLRSYYPVVEKYKLGFFNDFYVLHTGVPKEINRKVFPVRVLSREIKLDSVNQYAGVIDTLVADLNLGKNFLFGFTANVQCASDNPGILVFELHEGDSLKHWYGLDLFVRPDTSAFQYCCVYADLTAELKKADPEKTRLKIYVWNNRLLKSRIKHIQLSFSRPNYQYYGLTENIDP